jgi:hypothetical protein
MLHFCGIGDHLSAIDFYTTAVGIVHMKMLNWRLDGVIRGIRRSSVEKSGE